MEDVIILTKQLSDGINLKNKMLSFSEKWKNIPCYTKSSIVIQKDKLKKVVYIFSTWYMPLFKEAEVLEYFPNLKAIFYAAGSVKYFARPFVANGIRVFSASSANGIAVAEYVAAQIILANKGYYQAQRNYRFPVFKWKYNKIRRNSELHYGNFRSKVGLIGCGSVGSEVVRLLKPYDINVCVYDPYISPNKLAMLEVENISLQEMFANCDVVSNHLPDTDETAGKIDYKLLSLLKPTATFINTGRGRQVNEKDLCKILRKNPQMTALLDVTQHEPLWPWSPLYWRKNVFLTPHIAGSFSHEFDRMVMFMLKAYEDELQGKDNFCLVNVENLNKQA